VLKNKSELSTVKNKYIIARLVFITFSTLFEDDIHYDFFSVALQSLKDLGRLTYKRFLKLFRHMVGLPGRVVSPSQGLYLHRTTPHRKTRTNIHALRGI
jgi:hypothetical protein